MYSIVLVVQYMFLVAYLIMCASIIILYRYNNIMCLTFLLCTQQMTHVQIIIIQLCLGKEGSIKQ